MADRSQYQDYKYILQDLSRVYMGAKYSYQELLESEDVSFKIRMIIRSYFLKDVTADTTLESHLYYLEKADLSWEVLDQLGARVRVTRPRPGRKGTTVYKEEIIGIADLAALPPARKQQEGMIIMELQLSKLRLMQFSL